MRISDWSSDVCSSDLRSVCSLDFSLSPFITSFARTREPVARACLAAAGMIGCGQNEQEGDDAMSQLSTIATSLRFPEGPVALPDGSVIVVEIAAGRITRVRPDGTKETVAEPGGGPNGLAIGPDGKSSAERRVGKEWVSTGRSRWSPQP